MASAAIIPVGTPGSRLMESRWAAIGFVVFVLLIVWYAAAVWLNVPQIRDRYARENRSWTMTELMQDAWAMERPVLPAPHQIAIEMNDTILQRPVTSKRSLVYHSWVTLSATLTGFAFGSLLGILLAVGIVHVRTLENSLMPWVIASQTVPILAIAPMVIVVLGSIGLTGLVPKSLISMYLCFFPVTIGMVKGLRSPDPLQLDLMRTYNATGSQLFWKLRWPASMPFLFASLKVAVAISLVGAIVAELPTGATAGLGARLLTGSYYGQTIQIWSALITASLLAGCLVGLVGLTQKLVLRAMGTQPA